jgi:hypothetical protein
MEKASLFFSESRWRLRTGKKQDVGITPEQEPERLEQKTASAEYAFP